MIKIINFYSQQHTSPDYSCAYVTLQTDTEYKGYALTFTLGRGTEIGVY